VRALVFAIALAGTTTYFGPTAHADPPGQDPHMPNFQFGYCPGGQGGWGDFTQWCDGQPFPDATYWHQQFLDPGFGPHFTLSCLVHDGSPVPPPAPPGGCGGAA
jgi:hypothetical protein